MIPSNLLGLICLLMCGGGGLLWGLGQEKKRLRINREWIDRIAYIRRQIDCYLRPLDEIMRSLGYSDGRQALERLLQDTVPYLTPAQYGHLSAFVESIGKGYREEQLSLCRETLHSLQELYQGQASEHPRRVRVLTALWISLPLGVAVLLW